jgi:S-DNA-T family DNA segregation ATPase FtsK/SpoIIIE
MGDPRSVRYDVAVLVLAAINLFVWLSLISYDPADAVGPWAPPFNRIYDPDALTFPQNAKPSNWCGYWGAVVSDVLVTALGWGAYFATASLSIAISLLFQKGSVSSPLSRGVGWSLLLLSLCVIPAMLGLHPPKSPVIGGGGYLGALAAEWINGHFATVGSAILIGSIMFAGVLLTTDYMVLALVGSGAKKSVGRLVDLRKVMGEKDDLPKLSPATTKPVYDVPTSLLDDNDPPLPIKFHGRGDLGERAETKQETKSPDKAASTTKSKSSPLAALTQVAASLIPTVASSNAKPAPEKAESDTAETTDDSTEESYELEEENTAAVREIEVEGETVILRSDEAHETPGPKVRNRATKKTKEEDHSLDALDDTSLPAGTEEYVLPGTDLLIDTEEICYDDQAKEVRRKAKILEKTFGDFGFNVRVVEIETGPVIAQYEVELEAGLRLSKITSLADDLAIALRVPSVRIVAPIPGKNTVGIEVPNETRQVVRLKEVIEETGASCQKMKIPLFLGKDVSGNALTVDLATMPHLLIAGRTGTGKSVCLNAIICSILMTRRPDEVRMLMIDPKMVELSGYGRLPHLMHPVVTDMRKAEAILAWAVDKMEERYALLARAGVRHITSYNQLDRQELLDRLRPENDEDAKAIPDHLPFIVIVADEIADLMMTAGKEVEQHIIRLAQKSRAVGIHLILATQKPTVDVITGLIKSNLPARIAFQVASRVDSRVVLDEMGADKLLGNGDMLFLWPGTSNLLRGQGTYVSDDEINRVVDHCGTGEQNFVSELVNLKVTDNSEGEPVKPGALRKRDDLYEAAIDVVIREGRGSVSLLQRALGIGYGRAARLIDFMAEDGIVGDYNGSQAREVVISISDWEAMRSGGASQDGGTNSSSGSPPAKRRNKIRREEGWDNEGSGDRDPPPTSSLQYVPPESEDEEGLWDEDEEDSDHYPSTNPGRYH